MPWPKGKKRPPGTNRGSAGAGRKPGALGKVTRTFREAQLLVFEVIGGVEAYAEWARDNPDQFYQIAARMIPTEIVGPGPGGEHIVKSVVVELHAETPKLLEKMAPSHRLEPHAGD